VGEARPSDSARGAPEDAAAPTSSRSVSSRAARTLAVLILAAIVALSVGPLPVPDLPGLWAGLPHAIAYAALTGCLLVAWKPRRHMRASAWVAAAALAVVALGAVMEAAQALVGRDVELVDFGADVIGVVAVILVWLAARKRRAVSARDVISRP